jgi:hypothetical protein
MTRADGTKFGKSMGDNVWLGAHRTSPYRFYQYWIQSDDRDVEKFLLQLTMLSVDEIRAVVARTSAAPERREAQRVLAARSPAWCTAQARSLPRKKPRRSCSAAPTNRRRRRSSRSSTRSHARLTRSAFEAGDTGGRSVGRRRRRPLEGRGRRLLGQGGDGGRYAPRSGGVLCRRSTFGRFLLVRKGKRQVHLVVAE